MTRKAAVQWQDTDREKALAAPPSDWLDPLGGGSANRETARLSWEIAVRKGLADKLAGLIAPRRQRADGLRRANLLARSGLDGTTRDMTNMELMRFEPWLLEDEQWLEACKAWVGYLPGLKRQLAEAEAKLAALEGEAHDLEAAVRVVQASQDDADGAEKVKQAHGSVAQRMAARLEAARKAADDARAVLRENESAIAAAEARLTGLRKKAS